MISYFKSEKSKKRILALYDAKLESLGIATRSRFVKTSFGETHVLIAGEPENPPLVIVHGSNGCAPISLESYPGLVEHFQVFAVDVPAQPNKTEAERPSMADQSYGIWMNEILAALQLEEVRMLGFSFGGLVILKTLLHDERRIKAAFLAAPAFIVNGNPLKLLFRMFIPLKRYMKNPKRKYLLHFLNTLFSEPDDFAEQYLSEVFQGFELDFTPVPVIKSKEAKRITTPLFLFAAGKDIIFPGKAMKKKAKRIFPSLKLARLFPDSKHVQGRASNQVVEEAVLASLTRKTD